MSSASCSRRGIGWGWVRKDELSRVKEVESRVKEVESQTALMALSDFFSPSLPLSLSLVIITSHSKMKNIKMRADQFFFLLFFHTPLPQLVSPSLIHAYSFLPNPQQSTNDDNFITIPGQKIQWLVYISKKFWHFTSTFSLREERDKPSTTSQNKNHTVPMDH